MANRLALGPLENPSLLYTHSRLGHLYARPGSLHPLLSTCQLRLFSHAVYISYFSSSVEPSVFSVLPEEAWDFW